MDSFSKMTKLSLPELLQTNMNMTGNATGFPKSMVDSFLVSAGQVSPLMQLFLFVYRLIGAQFGLDPSVLLTLLGFLWGMYKILSQIYYSIEHLVNSHLMCAMYVSQNDQIYHQLMKWLSEKRSITQNRYLSAQTIWKSAWEEEEDVENSLLLISAGDDDSGPHYLNFSNQAARSCPRYVPAMGTTAFWHKGTYFRLNRRKESLVDTMGWSPMKDLEEIRISCFGRSIQPIKDLLADAKALYFVDTRQKTSIYRPRSKEQRRDGNMWQQVARRPVRPMQTVVLDTEEKHAVLADINEYLHPRTPRWYASRGIPLRRGYLFYGPPGTGKTSFSFALAGVFGIDIYVISLQDPTISEEDLAALFTRLPRRCIVLLEDIDTAGLRRGAGDDGEENERDAGLDKDKALLENGTKAEKKSRKKNKKKKEEGGSDDSSSSEDEKAVKRKKKQTKKSRGKGVSGADGVLSLEAHCISLSGLLNAIDGVASHEGRVLIMTTNKPESLDEALVRPGRVDLQVGFMNATAHQAGELFHRMYEASRKQKGALLEKHGAGSESHKKDDVLDMTAAELKAVSEEFGRLMPQDVFSPAEIQGFLLKRKKSPRKALDDTPAWVEAALKQKELKSKVMTVQ